MVQNTQLTCFLQNNNKDYHITNNFPTRIGPVRSACNNAICVISPCRCNILRLAKLMVFC